MKFLGGSPYGGIVVNDIVGERDRALLRQTFQSETSPAFCLLIYMRLYFVKERGRAAKKPRFSGAGCMKICFSINNSFGMA